MSDVERVQTPHAAGDPALVFIFGPSAVGKMTVGQELRRLTGYRLLYNHMVVDLVTEFFEFGSPPFHQLAMPLTLQIIEACARQRVGLIITHGLVFDGPRARALIEEWSAPYVREGLAIWYAELTAALDVRIARNETPNRARFKKIAWSTAKRLREMESWGRWNADEAWPDPARRIAIDNTDVPPETAARMIRERFRL